MISSVLLAEVAVREALGFGSSTCSLGGVGNGLWLLSSVFYFALLGSLYGLGLGWVLGLG